MTKKDELSEEHRALLAEAEELGVDTLGYTVPNAKLDRLREAIARRTEAIAKEAAAKAQIADVAGDDEEEWSGFDEAAGATRGVLVRLVEWTEWIPVRISDHLKGLSVANGLTGFEAGENEKVVSIESLDTNRRKRVPMDDDPQQYIEYSLHVMKAVLANNVTTDLLKQLVDLQGGNREGTEPTGKIVMPDAPSPNRAQRRRRMQ
jgi:hypothetical protein